jgi:hypothetical protein
MARLFDKIVAALNQKALSVLGITDATRSKLPPPFIACLQLGFFQIKRGGICP